MGQMEELEKLKANFRQTDPAMKLLKDRVWKEIHERVVNEDLIGKAGLWTSRDSEIFNSYPFKLLCEKVEELENKLRWF